MNKVTLQIIEELKTDKGDLITPSVYSHFYPRANVSAAFKIAKRDGIIQVKYMSCVGTPVYTNSVK